MILSAPVCRGLAGGPLRLTRTTFPSQLEEWHRGESRWGSGAAAATTATASATFDETWELRQSPLCTLTIRDGRQSQSGKVRFELCERTRNPIELLYRAGIVQGQRTSLTLMLPNDPDRELRLDLLPPSGSTGCWNGDCWAAVGSLLGPCVGDVGLLRLGRLLKLKLLRRPQRPLRGCRSSSSESKASPTSMPGSGQIQIMCHQTV